MKAKPLFLLFLMFLLFVTGCSTPSREAASFTRLEEMEIYRVLDANIDEESSLEEMLDAFSRMIQVPMDVSTDMYLLEIHPYEFEEKSYLACTIVRQFELPSHADLIEIGIPFSDPIAEGVVIQEADLRSLNGGTTTDDIFRMVGELREETDI